MINKYYSIYKPYGMLSQFSKQHDEKSLSDLAYSFEKDVYPVGRLDKESEGLLLLTNDKFLIDRLLNPKYEHEREYFVQVEGIPSKEKLEILESGIVIQNYKTKKAKVRIIDDPDFFPERNPPIRFRRLIPTTWLSIVLTEGKNRQVRRMTAAVGLPTLRLVRVRIGDLEIEKENPGFVRDLKRKFIYNKLNLIDQ